MALRDYLAGEVAEDYADGFLSRREALRRLGLLGLGVASASTLLAACGGETTTMLRRTRRTRPRDAVRTRPAGRRSARRRRSRARPCPRNPSGSRVPPESSWPCRPCPRTREGAVLVIHENRGLTPHFGDVVSRLATNGYAALSVDLLSSVGGTAALTDPAAAPAALADTPEEELVIVLQYGIDELARQCSRRQDRCGRVLLRRGDDLEPPPGRRAPHRRRRAVLRSVARVTGLQFVRRRSPRDLRRARRSGERQSRRCDARSNARGSPTR